MKQENDSMQIPKNGWKAVQHLANDFIDRHSYKEE